MFSTIKTKVMNINVLTPFDALRIIRFVIAGSIGAATDLLILYLLTDFAGLWYVTSTAVAFILAFVVSFVIQKYWTFNDHSHDFIHGQITMYFLVALLNTGLNTLIVYMTVHYFHAHYLLSQIVASILIAGESYFIYKFLFRDRSDGAIE